MLGILRTPLPDPFAKVRIFSEVFAPEPHLGTLRGLSAELVVEGLEEGFMPAAEAPERDVAIGIPRLSGRLEPPGASVRAGRKAWGGGDF